jgi:hypothetical protein
MLTERPRVYLADQTYSFLMHVTSLSENGSSVVRMAWKAFHL